MNTVGTGFVLKDRYVYSQEQLIVKLEALEVYRGVDKKNNNQQVQIAVYFRKDLDSLGYYNSDVLLRVLQFCQSNEQDFLEKILDLEENDLMISIVTEISQHGKIGDYFIGQLEEQDACLIFHRMLKIIDYFFSAGVVLGFISLPNFQLSLQNGRPQIRYTLVQDLSQK